MNKSGIGLTAAVLAAWLALPDRAPAVAGEDPKNEVLKKHGLSVVGSLAVLDAESAVKSKLGDVRRLSKQLSYAIMQQQGTMSPEEFQKTIKGLNLEISQLKSQ